MAKLKTKRVAMDTLCTQTDRGWEFETSVCGTKRQWVWQDRPGINLFIVEGADLRPLIFVKNLEGAALFCWGWASGADFGAKSVLVGGKGHVG